MAECLSILATLGTATAALGACTPAGEVPEERSKVVYEGVSAVLLDDGLVRLSLAMRGANDRSEVEAYGRCAVARYAQDQGYGFARQVRTIVKKEGQTWYGDAVYLISVARPEGLRTIDASAALTECAGLGIPTV